jgi:VanZ family protein
MRKILLPTWWASIALVIYLSLKPGLELPGDFWSADKVYHSLAYAWLMFLPELLFDARRRPGIALALVAMGIAIEYIQPSFGRTFEYGDMAVDAVGVLLGARAGQRLKPRLAAVLYL